MKIKQTAVLCSVGLFLLAGCSNYQHVPLPEYHVLQKIPPKVELPIRWVYTIGVGIDRAPEISDLDIHLPYEVDTPKDCVAFGSGLNSAAFTSVDEAYQRYFMRPNMIGADLKEWRDIFRRVLGEEQNFKDIQERGFLTEEGLEGFDLTGTKEINHKEYKYRISCFLFDDTIYMAECYGRTAPFLLIADEFDKSFLSADVSFWRSRRDRSRQYTFFGYDPVVVKLPECCSGLFAPDWFIFQLGFCPYAQIFDSQSDIYGLDLNLFVSKQKSTGGISFSLLNASKEHYGIQLAGIASSAEKNVGLNISPFYTAARENYGLSIGLFTVSEGNSRGVQIGLLNFSTSPYHLSWCPIINLPFFEEFHRR